MEFKVIIAFSRRIVGSVESQTLDTENRVTKNLVTLKFNKLLLCYVFVIAVISVRALDTHPSTSMEQANWLSRYCQILEKKRDLVEI